MLRIQAAYLTKQDKKLFSFFANWVLKRFVKPSIRKNSIITVQFVDPKTLPPQEEKDLNKYKAWSEYNGIQNDKRNFTITLDKVMLSRKKNVKDSIYRLEDAIECLGHELVHIKQYLNGEMFDYKEGDVRYRGQRFSSWEEEEKYWFTPWELEAYGYEQGLFAVFKKRYKGKFTR